MQIFIPSLGRASQMHRGTLSKLPGHWLFNTSLVCQTHEAEAYLEVVDQFDCRLLVLPPNIKTIEPTRRFIGEWCRDNGVDKMVMMDDDLEFYVRRRQFTEDDDWWKLTEPEESDVDLMLSCIDQDLNTYAHVGISGREGNNRVREPFVENTRYMRVLGYRVADYNQTEGGRVEVMEDFDVALQMLRQGLPSKVYYRWAQGQAKTQSEGGCSVWRTHELHNAGAERLADLHPGLVRTREKKNKTDADGFGTRKEVTVYWKKTFESSQNGETE